MLRNITILLSLIIGASFLYSQNSSNIVFYSSGGERFQVVLNGVKQNQEPQTNVKVTDLNAQNYEAKIIFQDRALGEISKMLIMPESSSEVTMRVVKNRKGRYVLRYFGEVAINQAPAPPTNQYVVEYAPVQRFDDEPMGMNISVTETTTTTTRTSGSSQSEGAGGRISVNVGGTSIDVGVSVNDPMMDDNVNMNSSTTVTTTTTTTTSGSSGFDSFNDEPGHFDDQASDDHYRMPGYDGKIGCSWPMQDTDFESAVRSIASKDFEDSKLTLAKQIISSNCLRADQVRDIMKLFEYESSRLEFAKIAYSKTFDQGNYYKVNDAFEYELSIDELNDHIVN